MGDKLCRDDDDETEDGGPRHVEEPALDPQRVNQVDARNIEDGKDGPDLGEGAANATPAGGGRLDAGDPLGDRRSVLQHEDDRKEGQHQARDIEHQRVDRSGSAEPPGRLGHGIAEYRPASEPPDPDVEIVAGLGVDGHEYCAGVGGQQHGSGDTEHETSLDRRIEENRQRNPGAGEGIERHRQGGVRDSGKDQDRQQVEDEAEQREQGADRAGIAASRRQARHQPPRPPAENPFGKEGNAENEGERSCGLDPQPSHRRIGDLMPGPAEQARRIDDHGDTGQDLAGQGVDLL